MEKQASVFRKGGPVVNCTGPYRARGHRQKLHGGGALNLFPIHSTNAFLRFSLTGPNNNAFCFSSAFLRRNREMKSSCPFLLHPIFCLRSLGRGWGLCLQGGSERRGGSAPLFSLPILARRLAVCFIPHNVCIICVCPVRKQKQSLRNKWQKLKPLCVSETRGLYFLFRLQIQVFS